MLHKKLTEISNEINYKIKELNYKNYSPKIIAVSKTFAMDKIKPLIDLGHKDFGENRVQEAVEKWSQMTFLEMHCGRSNWRQNRHI